MGLQEVDRRQFSVISQLRLLGFSAVYKTNDFIFVSSDQRDPLL